MSVVVCEGLDSGFFIVKHGTDLIDWKLLLFFISVSKYERDPDLPTTMSKHLADGGFISLSHYACTRYCIL